MKHIEFQQFAERNSKPESKILSEIRRDTWVNVLYPQMLSDELQGTILQSLSLIKKPTHILEIGSFTGYSAICLAAGLVPNGILDL